MFDEPLNKFCAVFGHNFKHVADIDSETTELVCKSCHHHFISTNNGNITDLSFAKETQLFSNYPTRKRSYKSNKETLKSGLL